MCELPIPPLAKADDRAVEVVRVWIAQGCLHCSLEMGVWGSDKVGALGIVLADIARHVANAISNLDGIAPSETIAQIRAAFDAEVDSPTDKPTGGFV